jgi:hypothetical protein
MSAETRLQSAPDGAQRLPGLVRNVFDQLRSLGPQKNCQLLGGGHPESHAGHEHSS